MLSAGKFFSDKQGIVYVDFFAERQTVNAEYYTSLLGGPVKTAIRNKLKKCKKSVCFLQDNIRPHTGMSFHILPIVPILLPQTFICKRVREWVCM